MTVSVSGPDLDRAAPSPEQGLSAAQLVASFAAKRGEEASYYVRRDDRVVYRVDVVDGVVLTYTTKEEPMLTIDTIHVPGRVWEDFLDPSCSTMQDELGLGAPERQKIGAGWRAVYRDVPVAAAADLAEYLHDRAETLLGQSFDSYDEWDRRARDMYRAAIRAAAEIRSRKQRAQVLAAEPGGTLDARRFA